MSHVNSSKPKRLDPRGPLVFDVRPLGPGSVRSEQRTVPAPPDLGAGMVRVPAGGELALDVQLEDVSDGVLVTATVTAPLVGECARCLEEFTSGTQVRFQELYARSPGEADEDGYLLDGDLLDLEPALRDAVVLELPLSPLCSPDCPGLCSECGARLADAGPEHNHAPSGGPFAVLKDYVPNGSGSDGPKPDGSDERSTSDGTTDPAEMKER